MIKLSKIVVVMLTVAGVLMASGGHVRANKTGANGSRVSHGNNHQTQSFHHNQHQGQPIIAPLATTAPAADMVHDGIDAAGSAYGAAAAQAGSTATLNDEDEDEDDEDDEDEDEIEENVAVVESGEVIETLVIEESDDEDEDEEYASIEVVEYVDGNVWVYEIDEDDDDYDDYSYGSGGYGYYGYGYDGYLGKSVEEAGKDVYEATPVAVPTRE